MSQYIFDNAAPQAAQRFDSLAALHDAATVRHLEALGVGEGWACWEIGGGAGSIATWIAQRVGATGRVLVTDIDPRYLAALGNLGLANVAVQRHDVAHDPLPPEPFDLIHARLVFIHIPTAGETLRQVVASLKPGGWLLIEDYDVRFVDRTFPTADPDAAATFRKVYGAVMHLLELHGAPPGWGRELYQHLRAAGLEAVGMEGHLAIWPGGSARMLLDRANLEQVRAEALAHGLLTEAEIERSLALLADPTVAFSSPVLFSAWGRRPTD